MITTTQNRQIPQPILSRLEEIDKHIESVLFEKNEINYLDQVKINDLENQIKKIYLKYAPKEKKERVKKLQMKIKELLDKEELDIQSYSLLDYEYKKELKSLKKPLMMSTLDDARVEAFLERIDEIYSQYEPKPSDLILIEKLHKEKNPIIKF